MSDIPNDKDIYEMNVHAMASEIRRLRMAIRNHRDQRGDDRCWMDDNELYAVLPEGVNAEFQLPEKRTFLGNCARHCEKFWENRQPPDAKIDFTL